MGGGWGRNCCGAGRLGLGGKGGGGMLLGQELAAGGENGAWMGSVGTGKVLGGGGGLWDGTWRGREDGPGGV